MNENERKCLLSYQHASDFNLSIIQSSHAATLRLDAYWCTNALTVKRDISFLECDPQHQSPQEVQLTKSSASATNSILISSVFQAHCSTPQKLNQTQYYQSETICSAPVMKDLVPSMGSKTQTSDRPSKDAASNRSSYVPISFKSVICQVPKHEIGSLWELLKNKQK